MNRKILIVTTSNARMGDNDEATGLWLEELTTPYYTFRDAGAEVTVASIAGGQIPVDERSLAESGKNPYSVERYIKDEALRAVVANTPALKSLDTSGYDALFMPGGHGTMWDFPDNTELGTAIRDALASGRIVSSVCHGPACLIGVTDASGQPLVKGKRITAFTDAEEDTVGLTAAVPFLLEKRLRELGADIQKTDNFQPFAVTDGNLITGQNPQSSALVAEQVMSNLEARKAA